MPRSYVVSWGTGGRVCRGHEAGDCADPGALCAPRADPRSQGFVQCVSHEGDKECPSAYVVKHVLYQDVVDNRTCTPCACEALTGSTCKALVSIFSDGACSSLVGSYQIDATDVSCHDIFPIGTALGSKSASEAEYTAGSCPPSGGDVLGEATPSEPTTFCCLP